MGIDWKTFDDGIDRVRDRTYPAVVKIEVDWLHYVSLENGIWIFSVFTDGEQRNDIIGTTKYCTGRFA